MNILLATDGSAFSRAACTYLIDHWAGYGPECKLTLMHVVAPLPVDIEMALGEAGDGGLDRYYEESHVAAFQEARERLDQAHIPYTLESAIGTPGETLARFAEHQKMDLIIMGSHGRGAFGSLVLGSVTARVLASCQVPVLIIR